MVKHIVIWKLKENARGKSKEENCADVKAALEALVGVVPGLLSAKVSRGFSADYDMMLESELESRDALAVYQKHEAHLKVKELVHAVIEGRASFDGEL